MNLKRIYSEWWDDVFGARRATFTISFSNCSSIVINRQSTRILLNQWIYLQENCLPCQCRCQFYVFHNHWTNVRQASGRMAYVCIYCIDFTWFSKSTFNMILLLSLFMQFTVLKTSWNEPVQWIRTQNSQIIASNEWEIESLCMTFVQRHEHWKTNWIGAAIVKRYNK